VSFGTATGSDVEMYAIGICHASVCCPETMAPDDLLDVVNGLHPTGLGHGWTFSTEKHFITGQSNPCPCERTSGRLHRLLVC
jgi:hypothetical protein